MDSPQTYVASMASVQSKPVVAPEVKEPRIEGDPLTAFENFHFQVQADLRGFMTHPEEKRVEMVKDLLATSPREEERLKLTPARRHKMLNYIIYIESHHPNGARAVAREAFLGLFPEPAKKAPPVKPTCKSCGETETSGVLLATGGLCVECAKKANT